MQTHDTRRLAAQLLDRLEAGDTLAVIEGAELLDAIADEADRQADDPMNVDYWQATQDAGALTLYRVLEVLYGHAEELDDDRAEADRIAMHYRAAGGREVQYRNKRVIVWHRGADPTWAVFDRPSTPVPEEPLGRSDMHDRLDQLEACLLWLRWRVKGDGEG